MPDRYALIGNPVAHSFSPSIHAEFARQTGQDIEYARLLAPLDGFAAAVAQFRAQGGKGLNVTLPFKLEAYQLATQHTERAAHAQAVNTLKFEGDAVFGDNTDGAGLVRDVEINLEFPIVAMRVLLMGAGGAARGALSPLLEKKPVTVVIANRTVAKAHQLARRFSHLGCSACGYDELVNRQFDLVINATAASIAGDLPPLPPGLFAPRSLAYDMMYGREPTPFLKYAREQGARIADGGGMLVEQAAESFLLWRGVRPDTAPVIARLRAGEFL